MEEEIKKVSGEKIVSSDLEKRKKDVFNFLKKEKNWIFYIGLAIITYIGFFLRTRNIPLLKDITTGTWTLGPDLDPFLFLRWAKDVVENGSLMAVDTMRNVPFGFNTSGEMKLLSYLMAWFHKVLELFSISQDVTYSSIIFPAAMFVLTTIAFFLFVRKVFNHENETIRNSIALISTALFIVIPTLLPRTIAGIPEKESAAFFFIFMTFYFFLEAFENKNKKKSLLFGLIAGVLTGMLALVWGGVTFVLMTISAATLFSFILGKIEKHQVYSFGLWVVGFVIIMTPFSTRYNIGSLTASMSTGLAFGVLFILAVDLILFKKDVIKIKKKVNERVKLPEEITVLIISAIILIILGSLFMGFSFVPDKIKNIVDKTVHPLDVSRFGLTVAENRQPFFINDWKNSFGPIFSGIPLFFWLFFIGSVYLFYYLIEKLRKKEKIILTFSYLVFLIGLIFSKYSPNSKLNGNSMLSFIVYFGGVILFAGCFIYIYYQRYKENELDIFKEFKFSYLLYFLTLTMTIIGARGATRLIMVLGAVSPVAIGFLNVKIIQKYSEEKDDTIKILMGIALIIVALSTIFTFWTYYKWDKATAENFGPSSYTHQWQKAMAWVRENTGKNAVFAHWWDYGYWLQSIGERATILDGGNAIVYWNHLMGRHVLTGPDERKALEFLYAHEGTHLLIDSTEIGKYTAYSSIGSDENYDRFSWIPSFLLDDRQTRETSNETLSFYVGGTSIDEDIVWEIDGKEVLLPKNVAGLVGIVVKEGGNNEVSQPFAIFVYNNQQYRIPLRFIYVNKRLYDFESGLDAGAFIYPQLVADQRGAQINQKGALMYFSPRTVHSRLAQLYLFEQESEYFKLVHTQESAVVEQLRAQGQNVGSFVYFQGFQGPIKIWEISYPKDIEVKQEYLEKEYPNEELKIAKQGEYN